MRDSTGTNRFNAPYFAARPALACVFDCFFVLFYYRFRVLRGINRFFVTVFVLFYYTIFLRGINRWCCICSAPACVLTACYIQS